MAKLYPPILEGTLPAFYGIELTVPFSMNKTVSVNEVKSILIKIKTIQSNILLFSAETEDFSLSSSGCKAVFNIEKDLNVGQYYKAQIAYKDINDIIGYYSTTGVIKYTIEPIVEIEGLNSETNFHKYSYIGKYQSEDKSEKVYSYIFNLYDKNRQLLQSSGEQIHNSYNDIERGESYDEYRVEQDLDLNQIYYLEYIITTLNGLQYSSRRYRIIQKQSIPPEIRATFITSLNYENGYIDLTLMGEKDKRQEEKTVTGSFYVSRSSEEDGYKTWNIISKFELHNQKPSSWTWRDFTIKQGIKYKYGLQQYNEKIISDRLESTEIFADFEHAYLFDGSRQLKLKYNPKVSSFKNNVLEQKTNTIGSQYPFIFRNGKVKYKEFSISGLISCRSDEEFLFAEKAAYDGTVNLTGQNIQAERDFKLEALEWLNNGEPKIFRSPGEGNYIIQLMSISASPTDTIGRMLHTLTGTAVEIADWTYSNLVDYGFIQIEDSLSKQLYWETISLNKVFAGNIISHQAEAISLSGLKSGEKLYFDDLEIIIGASGSYEIPLSAGIKINSIKFADSASLHQGTLTYAYYDLEKTGFNFIEGVQIKNVPLKQFIGEYDILDEIQDIKKRSYGFYWFRVKKRPVFTLYKKNGKYYTAQGEGFIKFQPWYLYQIIENNISYYEDKLNGLVYNTYQPYFIYNNKKINVEDSFETSGKDLANLQTKNGVILELSFQNQIIEYSAEKNLTNLKIELDTLQQELKDAIYYSTHSDLWIDSLNEQYKKKYNEYITALQNEGVIE